MASKVFKACEAFRSIMAWKTFKAFRDIMALNAFKVFGTVRSIMAWEALTKNEISHFRSRFFGGRKGAYGPKK